MAGISDLYNRLPVNMRVFVETALGNTSPITAEDFSDEDLRFLREKYEKTNAENERAEAYYRAQLERATPEAPYAEAGRDQYRKELEDKIKSYDDTRGKTSMHQWDYASKGYKHEGDWVDTIVNSFTDPSYRAGTTLGSFNVIQQEDGSVSIQDTYDWTKAPENISLIEFLSAVTAVKSPEQLGNVFMRLLNPDVSRKVDIKLPDNYSNGGRIRFI